MSTAVAKQLHGKGTALAAPFPAAGGRFSSAEKQLQEPSRPSDRILGSLLVSSLFFEGDLFQFLSIKRIW
jgi:hypothetical protein